MYALTQQIEDDFSDMTQKEIASALAAEAITGQDPAMYLQQYFDELQAPNAIFLGGV